MSTKIGKLAPIGVVAGAMGYFCWSHMEDTVAPPKPNAPTHTNDLTAALLSPPAAPDLERDPFARPSALSPSTETAAVAKEPAKTAVAAKPPDRAQEEKHVHESPAPINDAVDTGLILNGTYVTSTQRVAIINGELYGEGEPVTTAGLHATVKHVHHNAVVLHTDRGPAQLTYASLDAFNSRDSQIAAAKSADLPDDDIDDPSDAAPESQPTVEANVVVSPSVNAAGRPGALHDDLRDAEASPDVADAREPRDDHNHRDSNRTETKHGARHGN